MTIYSRKSKLHLGIIPLTHFYGIKVVRHSYRQISMIHLTDTIYQTRLNLIMVFFSQEPFLILSHIHEPLSPIKTNI